MIRVFVIIFLLSPLVCVLWLLSMHFQVHLFDSLQSYAQLIILHMFSTFWKTWYALRRKPCLSKYQNHILAAKQSNIMISYMPSLHLFDFLSITMFVNEMLQFVCFHNSVLKGNERTNSEILKQRHTTTKQIHFYIRP